jgi:hypothetical protein
VASAQLTVDSFTVVVATATLFLFYVSTHVALFYAMRTVKLPVRRYWGAQGLYKDFFNTVQQLSSRPNVVQCSMHAAAGCGCMGMYGVDSDESFRKMGCI